MVGLSESGMTFDLPRRLTPIMRSLIFLNYYTIYLVDEPVASCIRVSGTFGLSMVALGRLGADSASPGSRDMPVAFLPQLLMARSITYNHSVFFFHLEGISAERRGRRVHGGRQQKFSGETRT